MLERGERLVFYLVTKARAWDKPTYGDLADALADLADQCEEEGIAELAMPKIGCGLDGLKWPKVPPSPPPPSDEDDDEDGGGEDDQGRLPGLRRRHHHLLPVARA